MSMPLPPLQFSAPAQSGASSGGGGWNSAGMTVNFGSANANGGGLSPLLFWAGAAYLAWRLLKK